MASYAVPRTPAALNISAPAPKPVPSGPALPPYQTATWAGCGGRIKALPEDFQVDEVPLYPPTGTGEHTYVRLWKRGLSTRAALQRLSEATGVPHQKMGWAGQKDAQAVTTQWISLHATEPKVHLAEGPDLRILEVTRHVNKLRRGHLRGNRFAVRVRDVRMPEAWNELVQLCGQQGFPNLFGPQRFGPDGRNAVAGRRLLARLRGARRLRDAERFEIHAYQAALFNRIVARRLAGLGSLKTMLTGDLALLHRNGATFLVSPAELASAQVRADAGEISPSAPLFGCRVPLALETPGAWEQDALLQESLTLEDFRMGSKDASVAGERRPVREFPQNLAWSRDEADVGSSALLLTFALGPGVYATALLRELMKTPDLDPGDLTGEEA